MNIRKRTGEVVPFQEEKILNAMKKAFSGQAQELDDRVLDEMLSVVLKRLPENGGLTVERVQDEVERVLMECGHYEVAKAYILYREKRAALRRVRVDRPCDVHVRHAGKPARACGPDAILAHRCPPLSHRAGRVRS